MGGRKEKRLSRWDAAFVSSPCVCVCVCVCANIAIGSDRKGKRKEGHKVPRESHRTRRLDGLSEPPAQSAARDKHEHKCDRGLNKSRVDHLQIKPKWTKVWAFAPRLNSSLIIQIAQHFTNPVAR